MINLLSGLLIQIIPSNLSPWATPPELFVVVIRLAMDFTLSGAFSMATDFPVVCNM